jgi:glycosyltransferase involved in cell wall biosynthesis
MPRTPRLTIIVPSFNEEVRLPPSLELIAEYTMCLGHSTEVLVVDDGSTDRTAEVAQSFGGASQIYGC